METKDSIRQQIKNLKKSISESNKKEATLLVASAIEQLPCFKSASNILLYHSLPDELNTHNMINKWSASKSIFLPRINNYNLEILHANNTQLGAFNIQEPVGSTTVPLSTIDIAIIPGIAFDINGIRLGRGKGYYDRLLCQNKVIKIGICYDFQLYNELPSAPHDIPMDIIITPKQTIITNEDIN